MDCCCGGFGGGGGGSGFVAGGAGGRAGLLHWCAVGLAREGVGAIEFEGLGGGDVLRLEFYGLCELEGQRILTLV